MRANVLDISKTFDKVCHDGLLFRGVTILEFEGPTLGLLLFLICINDIPENVQTTVKLFADDTLLFPTKYNPNISASQQESDSKKKFCWSYKWKMTSNPGHSKQAEELIFSRKTVKVSHPLFTVLVSCTTYQKHFGLYLHDKLMIIPMLTFQKC